MFFAHAADLSSVWGLRRLSRTRQVYLCFIGRRSEKKKTNTLPSVGSLTDRLMQQFKDLENRDGDSRAVTDIELMKRNEWKMGRARKGNLCVGGERMDVVLVYSPLGQMRPRTIVNMIKHASQFFTYKQGPGPHIY